MSCSFLSFLVNLLLILLLIISKYEAKKVFPISSVTNKGLEEILNTVLNVIEEKKIKEDTKKWSP